MFCQIFFVNYNYFQAYYVTGQNASVFFLLTTGLNGSVSTTGRVTPFCTFLSPYNCKEFYIHIYFLILWSKGMKYTHTID